VPLDFELRQIAEIWITLGQSMGVVSKEDSDRGEEDVSGIILPPREIPGEEGEEGKLEAHVVGKGTWVRVTWGPYHRPTATQLQAMVGALTIANGQKPVLSQETTTTLAVNALSLGSPEDERARIEKEREAAMEQFGKDMFSDDQDDDAKAETAAAKDDAKANEDAQKKAKEKEKAEKEKAQD